MRDRILINFDEKPFQILKASTAQIGDESYSFELKKIDKDENLIEVIEKSVFPGYSELDEYSQKKIKEQSSKGFANTLEESLSGLEIIEQPEVGHLLKLKEYDLLHSTKFLKDINSAVLIRFESEELILNEKIIETYKYLINNQLKIQNEIQKGFWPIYVEEYENFVESQESWRDDYKLDKGYEEFKKAYLGLNPGILMLHGEDCECTEEDMENSHKQAYKDFKKSSDDFFETWEKIKNAETWEQKNKILDGAMYLKTIMIYDGSDPDFYGDMAFIYDYALDEEHGLGIKIKNGEFFEIGQEGDM